MSTCLYGIFDCIFFFLSRTRFRVNHTLSENSARSETTIFENCGGLEKFNLNRSFEENESLNKILQQFKVKNINRLKKRRININSLRNKSEMLKDYIKGNTDVLLI